MSDILLNSLKEFYMRGDNKKKLLEIINNTNISLRIIDWFVTNYSKKYNTSYFINSNKLIEDNKDNSINTDNLKQFNVYYL